MDGKISRQQVRFSITCMHHLLLCKPMKQGSFSSEWKRKHLPTASIVLFLPTLDIICELHSKISSEINLVLLQGISIWVFLTLVLLEFCVQRVAFRLPHSILLSTRRDIGL